MRRRDLLAGCAAGTAALAGCSFGEGETDGPEILRINPVHSWSAYGDVENQVSGFGRGGFAIVVFRFRARLDEEGRADASGTATVTDADGTVWAERDWAVEDEYDSEEFTTIEKAVDFETAEFDLGEYTAEVTYDDHVSDAAADPARTTFEVNEPLAPEEVRLAEIDSPDAVATGEEFTYSLRFVSGADRDSTFLSGLRVEREGTVWMESGIALNVPGGDERTVESNPLAINDSGTYTFTLEALEESFEVTVES